MVNHPTIVTQMKTINLLKDLLWDIWNNPSGRKGDYTQFFLYDFRDKLNTKFSYDTSSFVRNTSIQELASHLTKQFLMVLKDTNKSKYAYYASKSHDITDSFIKIIGNDFPSIFKVKYVIGFKVNSRKYLYRDYTNDNCHDLMYRLVGGYFPEGNTRTTTFKLFKTIVTFKPLVYHNYPTKESLLLSLSQPDHNSTYWSTQRPFEHIPGIVYNHNLATFETEASISSIKFEFDYVNLLDNILKLPVLF